MIDKLIERIHYLKNPSVVGLDTSFEYLPYDVQERCNTLEDAATAITDFNAAIIDRISYIAPAVKIQSAYYEKYGVAGIAAFAKTMELAKDKGLIVIADVKRNDIGSTAACYSSAYLGKVTVGQKAFTAFDSDFVTVNGYFGIDGIQPFLEDCRTYNKGIFVLVKTSNPSSGDLQDLKLSDGMTLYETVGEFVAKWGRDLIGESGFSRVGAVVGATHPKEAEVLRTMLPNTFFLVPGYGAQGATADELTVCFNDNGEGAAVNSSRGIICAYRKDKFKGMSFDMAAYNAAIDMQQDLYNALKRKGKIR